jgi:hypothetical protein
VGADAVVAAEGSMVNVLAVRPLCCERICASFDPRVLAANYSRALFVLLFLSADNDNVGLNLPGGVDRCSAVTPLAVDFDVLVKLELWLGHLISSLLPNTGSLRSPQIP